MKRGKVLTVANRKGGCTKSTLVTLFAVSLYNQGHKVLVVDNDLQGTITNLREEEEEEGMAGFDLITIDWNNSNASNYYQNLINQSVKEYDFIINDVAGKLEGEDIFLSLICADAILIPLIPRRFEISSTMDFIDSLISNDDVTKNILGIQNRLDNTGESLQLAKIGEYKDIKVLQNGLRNRVTYSRDISTFKEMGEEEYQKLFTELNKEISKIKIPANVR